MSYSELGGLNKNCDYEVIEELRNGYGTGPVVWDALCQEYLGTKEFGYNSKINELWPLYKDKNIEEYKRAVLVMTYDKSYLKKDNFSRFAKDCMSWIENYKPKEGRVNHWKRIAELIESNPDNEYIVLNCTSVCENPYYGEFNEDKEEYDPIDLNEFYEVYDVLNEE